MKTNIQDLQFTVPIEKISEVFLEVLRPYLIKEVIEEKQIDGYLTRNEVAEILNISLPTLNLYTKKGLLKSYKMGARVLYKKCEVDIAPIRVNYGRD
jgi:excisionase family DNA binding protein